jgi:hypothetical protein
MRQRVGEVSRPRLPTTSRSTQATSEYNPSGGSERRSRHISADGKGICKVSATTFGPLKMRCSAL